MKGLSDIHDYNELPEQEQIRYRSVARRLVHLAQCYAIPIILAPPLSVGGKVNGATGCFLQLGSRRFVVTASHVLSKYEERRQQGEVLNWQVGHLQPFDPTLRVAWRNAEKDIVLLEMSEREMTAASDQSSLTFSAPAGWPPSSPSTSQVVLVAGYPATLREVGAADIKAGPYSAMFRVASVNEGYFYCQIEHQELISFDGGPLPPPGAEIGGLSGGPVCLMTELAYPLIGIVTEHVSEYDLLRIATLDCVNESEIKQVL